MTAAHLSDARRNPVDIWTGLAVIISFMILGPFVAAVFLLDLLIRQPVRTGP